MKTIWKFILRPDEIREPTASVEMPKFGKPIHVEMQHENLCLWAEVDTTQPTEKRTFYVFGTGREMPEERTLEYVHIGTAQTINLGSALVLHVYERRIDENAIGDEE